MNKELQHTTLHPYTQLLRDELAVATGCTEPVAVAYAGSIARRMLGTMPETMEVLCSSNIIKNVKSVVVPGTNGLKGIEAAAVAGAVVDRYEEQLDLLKFLTDENRQQVREYLAQDRCTVKALDTDCKLHIQLWACAGDDRAFVEIKNQHNHVAQAMLNGQLSDLFPQSETEDGDGEGQEPDMTIRSILDYAQTVPLEEIDDLLSNQLNLNEAVSQEGLTATYGSNVGRHLIQMTDTPSARICAAAAAGSDARMAGCCLPVVINSGSGNQGIAVSVPIGEFARQNHCSHEQVVRALAISNLISIYIKHQIGRLSAFCGAVNAACGTGAAIAWLSGDDYTIICGTIINTLAAVSGIVCDGAKASCAAKIASSLEAALLGHQMACAGDTYLAGDGLVGDGADETITKIGLLGRIGMKETDEEIIRLMLNQL